VVHMDKTPPKRNNARNGPRSSTCRKRNAVDETLAP
jgi:hypothetical protein